MLFLHCKSRVIINCWNDFTLRRSCKYLIYFTRKDYTELQAWTQEDRETHTNKNISLYQVEN